MEKEQPQRERCRPQAADNRNKLPQAGIQHTGHKKQRPTYCNSGAGKHESRSATATRTLALAQNGGIYTGGKAHNRTSTCGGSRRRLLDIARRMPKARPRARRRTRADASSDSLDDGRGCATTDAGGSEQRRACRPTVVGGREQRCARAQRCGSAVPVGGGSR